MSAIRSTYPVAGQPVRGLVFTPVTSASADVAPSHDQDMMYAWSIGVTSAARSMDERSSKSSEQTHEESCPPEVYIG